MKNDTNIKYNEVKRAIEDRLNWQNVTPLGDIPVPVSYTHLDVYKRQVQINARVIKVNGSRENKNFEIPVKNKEGISCLLYTSCRSFMQRTLD